MAILQDTDDGHAAKHRPVERPPSFGWDGLTTSESRIVDLVGQGCSNAEIAAQLVVSRRTVESHLVRAYAKLGFTTRVQLVAAAARRQVAGASPEDR